MVGATSWREPPSGRSLTPRSSSSIKWKGTGLLVWAVWGWPVVKSSICSQLPWSAVMRQVPRAVRELNRVVKTGLVFGSVTSDMAPGLIDRYDLLRGVKKLGTWWEWSELFFGNGFDLSMHRRDCTDAVWAATLAANKGPGQWYADADSLRYSFFDKVESDD